MNSEQFCRTQEWKDYKDAKWKELYSIEGAYSFQEWDGESVDGRPTFLDYVSPHTKQSGNVIKCAYCGWYGEDIDIPFWSRETYFVLEHVLPVFSFPQLRLDDKNIVIACNHCNKDKGGKVLHSSLSDIIIKFQKDRLDGIIKNNKSFDERYGRVCEFK